LGQELEIEFGSNCQAIALISGLLLLFRIEDKFFELNIGRHMSSDIGRSINPAKEEEPELLT